jgi:competence protein ComEC
MQLLLPLCATVFAVGVVLGVVCELPAGPCLAAGAAAGGLALLVLRRTLAWLALVLAAALLAGATLAATTVRRPARSCDVSRHTSRGQVRLLATVADVPVYGIDGQRQRLEAEALLEGEEGAPLCGGVELHQPLQAAPLWVGERVIVRGRLRLAAGARNPGVASARLRFLSEEIGALIHAEEGAVIAVGPRRPSMVERLRGRIRGVLAQTIVSVDRRSIVASLVLGEEQSISPELRQTYARAGLSHLLAVSGLNLSLVAFGLLVGLRWLAVRVSFIAERIDPSRVAAPLAATVAIFYTLLTGAAPSAVRACFMACACYAGLMTGRAPDVVRPLAAASLALLGWDPLSLFRPSFQLSFAAVIGIALVADRLRGPRPTTWTGRCGRAAWGLLLTTLAATLLTAPVVAHHFHQVSVAGLLTNMIAVPLTSLLVLPLSLIGAALGALFTPLGQPLLWTAGWLAGGLNELCRFVAAWELASLQLSIGWVGALGLSGLAVAALTRGRARVAALVVAAAFCAWTGVGSLAQRSRPALEVTFLDVGQGDSSLLQLPDGGAVLVDAGGASFSRPSSAARSYDPGAAQVVPLLQARGVRQLELVVASHPHPDHVGGLAAVLDAVPVRELWLCWHDEEDVQVERLRRAAERHRVPIVAPRLVQRGGVRIEPLWPEGHAGRCADPADDANDNSVVLRVSYGRSAIIFAGDIEASAEERLVRRHGDRLRADLLKVPHHGSATSSTEESLRAIAPRLAVISCGVENAFGFPAPKVLARYRAMGIPVARIDQLGAVGVRLQADGTLSWRALTGVVP